MSRHSKREISFYKGVNTGVSFSLFYSHCSVSGTYSVLSNSKTTYSRTCNYKKISIQCFDRGSKKRTSMVDREPTTNQKENLDKSTTPNSNINQFFFGRLGSLFPRSKDREPLGISREERSYKCFRTEGSEVCNFNFFLFVS